MGKRDDTCRAYQIHDLSRVPPTDNQELVRFTFFWTLINEGDLMKVLGTG